MKFAAVTNVGKRYSHNEDKYFVPNFDKPIQNKFPFFMVCDGVGGANSGEIASKFTVDFLSDKLYSDLKNNLMNSKTMLRKFSIYIEDTNHKLVQLGESSSTNKGMATTIISAFFGEKLLIHSVGDSRIYVFRNHILTQLNEDQSFVWELYKRKLITKNEIRTHPKNNLICMAVGNDGNIEINETEFEYQKGDLFLLCSDGLTDLVSEKEIRNVLKRDLSLNEKNSLLEDRAMELGGKDNITIILIEV